MKYTDPEIYFGCLRVPGLDDDRQPKDITKEWYVHYMYELPEDHPDRMKGKTHKFFKVKAGINRYHDLKLRTAMAKKVKAMTFTALCNDYDPFQKKIIPTSDPTAAMLFGPAIEWALAKKLEARKGKKALAHKTVQDYRSQVKMFVRQAAKLKYASMPAKWVKRKHLMQIMETLQEQRGFGPVRYNEILGMIKELYRKQLVPWEIVDGDMASGIGTQDTGEPEAFEPLTVDEKQIIYRYFSSVNPEFLTFYLCIYHGGIRPSEALRLKPAHLLFSQGLIVIPEDVGKTGKKMGTRYAPMPEELSDRLRSHVAEAHPDMYLFGAGFKPERREKPVNRNRTSDYWRAHVKEELCIDKDMYGGKHTGGEDRYDQGMDVGDIQGGFGHASEEMTKNYLRKLQMKKAQKVAQTAKPFLPEQSGK